MKSLFSIASCGTRLICFIAGPGIALAFTLLAFGAAAFGV